MEKSAWRSWPKKLLVELPPSIEILVGELRGRAQHTLSGTAPPSLPAPPKLEVVPEPPPAPSVQVFTLESLQWCGERGRRESCGPFQIHALPTPVAKIALARGLALKPDSKRAQAIIHNKAGLPHLTDSTKTFDLDRPEGTVEVYRDGRKVREEPQQRFTPLDRGPPRQAWVDRPAELISDV